MQQGELHVVGEAPAGVRSEGGHAMDERAAHGFLRERSENTRERRDAASQRRGEAAMGFVLTAAGWFWVGYVLAAVFTVIWGTA